MCFWALWAQKAECHLLPSYVREGTHVSCHISKTLRLHPSVICNRFIPFMGSQGVLAGANPSCLWARAEYSLDKGPLWWRRPPCKVPATHQEQSGVQYLAEGHFDMQISSAQSWDLNQWPSDHTLTCSTCWATVTLTWQLNQNNLDGWTADRHFWLDLPFSYHAPQIWNKLPENCRSAPTLTSFKSRLKTYMFATAFHSSNFKAFKLDCDFFFLSCLF